MEKCKQLLYCFGQIIRVYCRCCREAQNSNVLWKRTLAGGMWVENFYSGDNSQNVFECSGNAALSSDETTLIIDNLSTAVFDIYNLPASDPSRSLSLAPTRRFTKQCTFVDGAKIAVCGSDSNNVHVMDVTTGKCLQTLTSGKGMFWKHFRVYIVDRRDKRETWRRRLPQQVQTVVRSPADRPAAVSVYGGWVLPSIEDSKYCNDINSWRRQLSKSNQLAPIHKWMRATLTWTWRTCTPTYMPISTYWPCW